MHTFSFPVFVLTPQPNFYTNLSSPLDRERVLKRSHILNGAKLTVSERNFEKKPTPKNSKKKTKRKIAKRKRNQVRIYTQYSLSLITFYLCIYQLSYLSHLASLYDRIDNKYCYLYIYNWLPSLLNKIIYIYSFETFYSIFISIVSLIFGQS